MKAHYLFPKFDKKDFKGKAIVVEEIDSVYLLSYGSIICEIRKKGEDDVDVIIYDYHDYNSGDSLTFSNSSLRHLKEFLKQNGLDAKTAGQIRKDYSVVYKGEIDRLKPSEV